MTLAIAYRPVLTYQLGRLAAGHGPRIGTGMGFALQINQRVQQGKTY